MHEIECILHEYLSFNWDRVEDIYEANSIYLAPDGLACSWKSHSTLQARGPPLASQRHALLHAAGPDCMQPAGCAPLAQLFGCHGACAHMPKMMLAACSLQVAPKWLAKLSSHVAELFRRT
jgi:hypothetical protein